MDKREYLNCLRIQIVPEFHEKERIKSVLNFCLKHDFKNVMLFINAEEYNLGHITKEEAKPWVAAIKRAKAVFETHGLTVSLNPWIEMGHLDRLRVLKKGQNFTVMEDFNGKKSKFVACPMDEEWQKYYLDLYEYLIKEIKPDTIWIEDDFRLHNHAPLEYGGCFCPKHLKAFNEKLGTNYTREEFKEKLFGDNPDKEVQRAFLDVNRECMRSLAQKIGDKVRSIGLHTKIGLMSSAHIMHSAEGRDWYGIQKAFETDGVMIDRLHLPCYDEISPKVYFYNFNYFPFICRGLLPRECEVYPELENSAFSTFAKDSEFLRFQVESALPLDIKGMTYDIFDFVGNGAIEAFGYGEKLKKCKKYFDAAINCGYDYYNLKGVVLPIDEKNAYNRDIKPHNFYSLIPDEFHYGAYLQCVGVAAKTSKEKRFSGETVVLCGANVNNFTDEELTDLFANNKVLVEGGAVMKLCERGLNGLIGVKSCRFSAAESTLRSFERVEKNIIINGIKEYAASAFDKAGNVVEIEYEEQPVILSRFYDNAMKECMLGETISRGHFVTPFIFDGFHLEQFNPLRSTLVTNYIKKNCSEAVVSDYEGVCSYHSRKDGKNVLILVNSTLKDLNAVRFFCAEKIDELYEIKRDGNLAAVNFAVKDGNVCVKEKFKAITTKIFIWQEK